MDKLLSTIKSSKKICISGHINSDGDSLGAAIAMSKIIENLFPDKEIHVLSENIPSRFDFLSEIKKVSSTVKDDIDLFVAVDCADSSRLGIFKDAFDNAKKTVNIDHHISNSNFADLNFVDSSLSSTSELLYIMFKDENIFDKDIATCIYTGILTDTGGFSYDNTSSETMLIASELLKYGIDITTISKKVFFEYGFSEIRIIGEAYHKAELLLNGKIVYSSISIEDMKKLKSNKGELGSIVSNLANIKGVEVSAFFYQLADKEIKLSLRANSDFNVASFCEKFEGGGHKKAAGCTIYKNLDESIDLVTNMLINEFQSV